MSQDTALSVIQESLAICFKVAGPILLASLLIGLVVSIIQAATQIHEQTLTFVPKLIAIALLLLLLAPWIMSEMSDFIQRIFDLISQV